MDKRPPRISTRRPGRPLSSLCSRAGPTAVRRSCRARPDAPVRLEAARPSDPAVPRRRRRPPPLSAVIGRRCADEVCRVVAAAAAAAGCRPALAPYAAAQGPVQGQGRGAGVRIRSTRPPSRRRGRWGRIPPRRSSPPARLDAPPAAARRRRATKALQDSVRPSRPARNSCARCLRAAGHEAGAGGRAARQLNEACGGDRRLSGGGTMAGAQRASFGRERGCVIGSVRGAPADRRPAGGDGRYRRRARRHQPRVQLAEGRRHPLQPPRPRCGASRRPDLDGGVGVRVVKELAARAVVS